MKNNKIILENKGEVRKGMPEADIIKNMETIGFECIFKSKKYSKHPTTTSNIYLFLKSDTGLCEIETYRENVSTIQLHLNYKNKNSDDFSKNFYMASWSSSTGAPSGYGYTIKVGTLMINGSLEKTLDDMKVKGNFIFPFTERHFFVPESVFSNEEKETYPILNNFEKTTQWFIDNKIQEPYRKFFGSEKNQDKQDVMNYWDDYIRWNYSSQGKKKIDKQDKKFYTTCKDIILKDIEEIKPLIDKNFIYQTTSLGQNFCHLMSIIQEPTKKEFLWNAFQTLTQSHQTNFITQNDVNGYNPLLILVQHQGIRPVKDSEMNLDYFNKYLSIKGIDIAFSNEKNSLLDCLLYGNSLSVNRTIPYLSKIVENDLNIPLVYLKKEYPFSSKQKVIDIFKGEDVKKNIASYVSNFINSVELNKKISKELQPKEVDNTKIKKI